MKKSLIALAVAGAMTAPMVAQADATVYGSLRLKIEDVKGEDSINMADNSSRIGIRGKQETGVEGLIATYRFEQPVSTETGAFTTSATGSPGSAQRGRLAYAGLSGGFGTAQFGRMWSPHYDYVQGKVDVLDGPSSNQTSGLGRIANATAYITPEMGGFSGALALVTDTDNTDFANTDTSGDDVDAYNLAAKYVMGGLDISASYIGLNSQDDADKWALGVSYSMDALYLAALYTESENAATAANDSTGQYELVATYDLGNVKLLANYADFDKSAAGVDQGSLASVEAWYKFGNKARAFVNYTAFDSDAEATGEADTFAVGYRVDF